MHISGNSHCSIYASPGVVRVPCKLVDGKAWQAPPLVLATLLLRAWQRNLMLPRPFAVPHLPRPPVIDTPHLCTVVGRGPLQEGEVVAGLLAPAALAGSMQDTRPAPRPPAPPAHEPRRGRPWCRWRCGRRDARTRSDVRRRAAPPPCQRGGRMAAAPRTSQAPPPPHAAPGSSKTQCSPGFR